jgi:uncharacterized protein (TIGR02270 family)
LSPSIVAIVRQYAEGSVALRNTRSILTAASHVGLRQLGHLDDRLVAHLDGLAIAGADGWRFCEAALENPGVGEVFTASVRAIEDRSTEWLGRLFAIAEAAPATQPGLISAFGWVSAQHLQGMTKGLLSSTNPFHRAVGLATCAMHKVDPGAALGSAIADGDPYLRARGLRTAGQLGRRDQLDACVSRLIDEDAHCGFWAAHSAVLLGNRDVAVRRLQDMSMQSGPHRMRALQSLLKVVDPAEAYALLKTLVQDSANRRLAIQGTGIAGDPRYAPWLMVQMEDPEHSRVAGESFSFMTGLDLVDLRLERTSPEDFKSGPSDDPDDPDVAMDPDENLPWPEPAKIQVWWEANKSRFTQGVRYFMGAPVTTEHCVRVLKEGYQRQRIAAAQHLCFQRPGTQLFPTSAPAWRQQRWLAQMS